MKMKEREVKERFLELQSVESLTLPSKLSFAIAYNLGKFQRESERIEKERKKLCEQYAEKDKNGNPVMVNSVINGIKMQEYKMTEENKKLLNEEYNELLDMEVDIEIRTAKQELIERCEEVERYSIPSVSQLSALSFMLEE